MEIHIRKGRNGEMNKFGKKCKKTRLKKPSCRLWPTGDNGPKKPSGPKTDLDPVGGK